MFAFIFTALLNGLAIWLGAKFLEGVKVTDFTRAVITGLVLAFLNVTLGNLLNFISTPIRYITLGLSGIVVDALMLLLADHFLKGLSIKNFWYSIALAVFVSLVNTVAHWLF